MKLHFVSSERSRKEPLLPAAWGSVYVPPSLIPLSLPLLLPLHFHCLQEPKCKWNLSSVFYLGHLYKQMSLPWWAPRASFIPFWMLEKVIQSHELFAVEHKDLNLDTQKTVVVGAVCNPRLGRRWVVQQRQADSWSSLASQPSQSISFWFSDHSCLKI